MDSDPASPTTSTARTSSSDEADKATEAGTHFPLTVHAAWDETPSLRGVSIAADAALLRQYTVPGQYLEVHHPSLGHGYFALAAAPGAPADERARLELLIRRGSGLADALSAPDEQRPEGIFSVGVRGHGFPIFATDEAAGADVDPAPPRDLLLVAAGSGIAPLRAVLQKVYADRARFGRVGLIYGQRHEAELAYRRGLEAWQQAAGSAPASAPGPPAGWRGGGCYAQQHLGSAPPPWLGAATTARLCGMSAMITAVTRLLRDTHQLRAEQILLNY